MQKLFRSRTNRVIAGVCGGLGEYLNIDPVVVRIIWILLSIFEGVGLILYVIAWILIPSKDNGVSEEIQENKLDSDTTSKKNNTNLIIGIVLVLLGLIFIIKNYCVYNYIIYYLKFTYRFIVPIGLIVFGLFLIFRKK